MRSRPSWLPGRRACHVGTLRRGRRQRTGHARPRCCSSNAWLQARELLDAGARALVLPVAGDLDAAPWLRQPPVSWIPWGCLRPHSSALERAQVGIRGCLRQTPLSHAPAGPHASACPGRPNSLRPLSALYFRVRHCGLILERLHRTAPTSASCAAACSWRCTCMPVMAMCTPTCPSIPMTTRMLQEANEAVAAHHGAWPGRWMA